jgi:hypothetical protein
VETDMPRLADASAAAAAAVSGLALLLMFREPLDSIIILGALAAAAAMIAAGWGDEGRPAPIRYGFLALAALHATLVIWIAFNIQTIFDRSIVENQERLALREPWSWLLLLSSFLVLAFAVHATVQRRRDNKRLADFAFGVVIPSVVLLIMLVLGGERMNDAQALVIMGLLFCGLAIFLNRGRPLVLASIMLAAFFMIFLDDARGGRIITQERSFFGVLRTRVIGDDAPSADGGAQQSPVPPLRILMHGTTIHGAQLAAPGLTRQPLTYYHPRTALGEAIVGGLATAAPSAHLALIGLGAGSTACLMRPGDQLTIFEIDPAVVRLSARPGGDFTYVPECQPGARVELGDARLQIAEEPDNAFDVIVVDAFSSDAIPAHLLTREALQLYLTKLKPTGVVVLHLSNRNLALVSEAARVARDINAPTLFRLSERFEQPYVSYYGGLAASVMIVAHSPDVLTRLQLPSNAWRVFEAPPGRGWTDDYINMPRALWEGLPFGPEGNSIEQCRVYTYLSGCDGEASETPQAQPGAAD